MCKVQSAMCNVQCARGKLAGFDYYYYYYYYYYYFNALRLMPPTQGFTISTSCLAGWQVCWLLAVGCWLLAAGWKLLLD